MMTLRRRLLLLLLPALALLMLLGALADYWVATATTQEAYDRALTSTARTVAAYLAAQGLRTPGTPARLSQLLIDPDHAAANALLYSLSDAHGRLLAGSAALNAQAAGLGQPGPWVALHDARVEGAAERIATVQLPPSEGGIRLSIAEPSARRAHTQRVMLFGKLMVDFAELDVTLLVIWSAVYFGLKPLRRIEACAEEQATSRLQRFDESQVPGELRSLVVAFNRVLELLQDAAAAQRRFVADAAHQMRTPVAGLLAQIELLLQDPRAAAVTAELRTLQRGTQSLARSANQLLTLARTEPVAALQADLHPISLAVLVHVLVERHLDRADQAGIDLGVSLEPALGVIADPRLLEELLENLVDNALKYTPRGGHVTVRDGVEEGRPYLEVVDDGPGIPEPERSRVRERFYRRPGAPGTGAGLGLAIVDEIARLHDADFLITSVPQGGGACMRVRFPRASLTPLPSEDATRDVMSVAV